MLASSVGFLAASVVNVAIPAIGRDMGSGVSGLQWVLTGYLVTVVALLPLSGALADRLGRRRVLAAGLLGRAETGLSSKPSGTCLRLRLDIQYVTLSTSALRPPCWRRAGKERLA